MGDRRIDYEEIHRDILNASEQLFKEKGIIYTEMKDIAKQIGVGRSTLYRHFSNKESILFELAEKTLTDILNGSQLPLTATFQNGMDEFSQKMHALLKQIITKKDEIVFLRDFDVYFSEEYPDIEAAQQYEDFAKNLIVGSDSVSAVERGLADGSIARKADASVISGTVIHYILAMAQRILPREGHFLKESQHSHEFLEVGLDLLLDGLRA